MLWQLKRLSTVLSSLPLSLEAPFTLLVAGALSIFASLKGTLLAVQKYICLRE